MRQNPTFSNSTLISTLYVTQTRISQTLRTLYMIILKGMMRNTIIKFLGKRNIATKYHEVRLMLQICLRVFFCLKNLSLGYESDKIFILKNSIFSLFAGDGTIGATTKFVSYRIKYNERQRDGNVRNSILALRSAVPYHRCDTIINVVKWTSRRWRRLVCHRNPHWSRSAARVDSKDTQSPRASRRRGWGPVGRVTSLYVIILRAM